MPHTSSLIQRLKKFRSYGIIGRLRRAIAFTDEPKFSQWFCEPSPSRQKIIEEQYGSSLALNDKTAKVKAIAEAIERYCSETVDLKRIIRAPYVELSDRAVDPATFINYSDTLLRSKKEKYISKLRKTQISWVNGKHLNSSKDILIPAQLVYSPYNFSKEPLIRVPISTGAAFGIDKKSALERGLLEIIERDSFMLFWLTKSSPLAIDLSNLKFNKLEEYFRRYLLEPYVFDISNDLEIPVMMGIILDRTGIGPAVSVGLKSSLKPTEAVIGSLLEAQHVRGWIRFSFLRDNKPNIRNIKDIVDLKTRGYYWYPTKSIRMLDFLFKYRSAKTSPKKKDILKGKSLDDYLINKGFDLYSVDLSTKEVRDEGFRVIKTIVPQLHPLSLNESIPYDFSERLSNYHIKNLNKTPHPFL